MGPVLIVEDEDIVRRIMDRYIRPHRDVVAVGSASEAQAAIRARRGFGGFLIDVRLGREPRAGLNVLMAARRRGEAAPATIVTSTVDKDVINDAAALGAMFICKPFGMRELDTFLQRVAAFDAVLPESFGVRVGIIAKRYALAPKESEVLAWLIAGKHPKAYLQQYGHGPSSWRNTVGRLLDKTGYAKTSDLVNAILRGAFPPADCT